MLVVLVGFLRRVVIPVLERFLVLVAVMVEYHQQATAVLVVVLLVLAVLVLAVPLLLVWVMQVEVLAVVLEAETKAVLVAVVLVRLVRTLQMLQRVQAQTVETVKAQALQAHPQLTLVAVAAAHDTPQREQERVVQAAAEMLVSQAQRTLEAVVVGVPHQRVRLVEVE